MTHRRTVGSGTNDDPKIMWICTVTRDPNRTEGCEAVCKAGCTPVSGTHVWIRHVDHDTTRTRSRGGLRMVRTDPHLTVYMSRNATSYEYQGHLFIVYDRSLPGKVPKALASSSELQYHRGSNPELWYYQTTRRVVV